MSFSNQEMSLLLHLMDGREIRLGVDPEEWTSAFENALTKNEVVQIDDPSDGARYGINPRLVLYWKVESDPPPDTD